LFFIFLTTLYLNEGHYIFAFLLLYWKAARKNGITFKQVQKDESRQNKLKKELLTSLDANRQPRLIPCDSCDQEAAYEALCIAEVLYGRQPNAGYQAGSGRAQDDNASCLHGAGTRTHRFAIRLGKLATQLCRERSLLERGPLPALELIPQLLQTNSAWKPYQAQLVVKCLMDLFL
jgi:hypothetical protein